MKPTVYQGQLTTWKDDRGFGFIKPQDGTKEVFIHISALKGAGRRPKVGDTILYERVVEANGKIRASQASIQGISTQSLATQQKPKTPIQSVPARSFRTHRKPKQNKLPVIILGMGVIGIISLIQGIQGLGRSLTPSTTAPSAESVASVPKPACTVKGNISISSGRKLYHIPGMEDYETTAIDPLKGERWFCTEAEAIANGWQKAPR